VGVPVFTALTFIDHDAGRWAQRVGGFGNGWVRVAGSAQDLMALAERIGQRWLKGIGLALRLVESSVVERWPVRED
jgi:hypothetical protein